MRKFIFVLLFFPFLTFADVVNEELCQRLVGSKWHAVFVDKEGSEVIELTFEKIYPNSGEFAGYIINSENIRANFIGKCKNSKILQFHDEYGWHRMSGFFVPYGKKGLMLSLKDDGFHGFAAIVAELKH